MIERCQRLDPGSIPGRRITCRTVSCPLIVCCCRFLPLVTLITLKILINMPSGKKRKRHKIATHKRKKRLRKNRHKKKQCLNRKRRKYLLLASLSIIKLSSLKLFSFSLPHIVVLILVFKPPNFFNSELRINNQFKPFGRDRYCHS